MYLKFYHSFIEFEKDFEDNFNNWKNKYPNGNLEDFKNEYLKEYENFHDNGKFALKLDGEDYTQFSEFFNKISYGSLDFYIFLDDLIEHLNLSHNPLDFDDTEIFLDIFEENNDFLIGVQKDVFHKIRPLISIIDDTFYIDNFKLKDFELSVPKIISFLTQEKEENNKIVQSKIESNINQTELVELVKALIENKTVVGVQKDIMRKFGDFFGIEIKNEDQKIQNLKNRCYESETLFLNKLSNSLVKFIKGK